MPCVGDDPRFLYRADVLAALPRHGVCPTPRTRPELVRSYVRDLYKWEIRKLREQYLRGEFSKQEYWNRVDALRRRYPVLALLPQQFLQHSRARRMTAIEIREPGPPEVLTPVERPVPAIGPADVLIKVSAAGVNRPDVLQRLGRYPPPPGASDIPGLEVAGAIEAVGADVRDFGPGDLACALVAGGGYAEYCAAPAPQCLPVPRGMDLAHAAAIPETFFTVWTNVFERGRLARGESILVHGGSSGIGTTAIQLARAFGARVFATAGSDEKCAACETLGAERAINYRTTDFVAALREATGGRGVDVVLDMVAGQYLERNLDVLAMEGRLLQIGLLGGARAEVNLMPVLQRRLWITGSTLRARSVAEKGAIAGAVRQHIWPLLESGAVRPIVHATFPLRNAAEAHRVMEASTHIGKLVLVN
jgi:putative PIG3 family NAD(P)H quinone oxidoreductase